VWASSTCHSTLLEDCGELFLAIFHLQALAPLLSVCGSYVDRLEACGRACCKARDVFTGSWGPNAGFRVKQVGEKSCFHGCFDLCFCGGRHFDPVDICLKGRGCSAVGRSLRHLHAEILALLEVLGGVGYKHGEDAVEAVVAGVHSFVVGHNIRHLVRNPPVSIKLAGSLGEVLLDHGFPWITDSVGVKTSGLDGCC
jgi:hypothetical protein